MPRVNAATAIALLFSMMKIASHAGWVQNCLVKIIALGFELLQADKIRRLVLQPGQKAFFDRRTNAIEIGGNDA